MRNKLLFTLFSLVFSFLLQAQNLEGSYQSAGYFFHPSASRYLPYNSTKTLTRISDNKYQLNLADLGGSGFSFQFDVDVNNNLVNWVATGSTPTSPASGFMTVDNPGGYEFYPAGTNGFVHSTFNNRYDPATKTFYMHYGYQSSGTGESSYQRQIYERLVRIPQPKITSISPLSGSYRTEITVTGKEFTGSVPTLGSQYPALVDSFSVLSDSVMKIWVGYAYQNVSVRVHVGADSSADVFAYTQPVVNANSDWNYIGSAGFSSGKGSNVNMALTSNNTPYVVYVDSSSHTIVMKYESGNWTQVGGWVSEGKSSLPNIKVGSDNKPLVCYVDSANGNNITVKRYDSANWVTMGTAGFAPYNNYGSISMSLDGGNMPYVLSSVISGGARNVSVYKYNGSSWMNRGMVAIGVSEFSSMDVDKLNNKVYVAYSGADYQASVKVLMDTSWMIVGNGSFTNALRGIYFPTIRVDKNGTPYVVLQYDDYHERLSIYKYQGGVWSSAGSDRFTKSHSYEPSLTFDKNGFPVLAYNDISYMYSGSVMRFSADTGYWKYVGARGFLPGFVEMNGLQTDTLDNFYIAFSDRNNDNRVSVIKFGNNVPTPVSVAQNLEGSYQSAGYFFHPSASRYLPYNSTKTLTRISDNKYQLNLADLGGSGFSFQFDVDVNNNLVNWVATGSTPTSPASGFMTVDNPGGYEFYPAGTNGFVHSTFNNRYDPATKTFYMHYGYQSSGTGESSYQRQIYERLVRIPQPKITSISPLSGSYRTEITVTGKEFTGSVPTLGSQYPALVDSFSVLSDSVMKIWVGYAYQNVSVRVHVGADSSADVFAYTQPVVNANSDWNYIGSAGFSSGKGSNVNMALTSNNTPYVVYVDSSSHTIVMKYESGNWTQVGGWVSEGKSSLPNIKVGSDNKPLVCYVDSANGNNITVKRYDSANWVTMGTAGFAPYNNYGSISMSLDGGNMPYVLSSVISGGARNVSVYKYNGSSWMNRGMVAIGVSEFSSMDVDKLNNKVYVAYSGADYQASVKVLMDTSWMIVGNGSFTNALRGIYFPTIRVDKNGTPYVVLQYDDYHERLSIYKYQGGVWSSAGSDRFTKSHSYEPSLTFDKNGFPVLAYNDISYMYSGSVMRFSADTGYWKYVGARGFLPGFVEMNGLQTDTLDNFYIAFSDRNNDNRVSVIKTGWSNTNYFDINVNACNSYILPWGDTVNISGNYIHTYSSSSGIDSTINYHVNINSGSNYYSNVDACSNFVLPWGDTVTTSGMYEHTYFTQNGCDSIVKINVNISGPVSSETYINACDSFTLPWSTVVTASGVYQHSYYSSNGCDSVVYVYVTINTSVNDEYYISACDNYQLPWGATVDSSGTYSISYQAINGCDSVVTYYVQINPKDTTVNSVTSCDAFLLPWGEEVIVSGEYSNTYSSASGCDSLVVYHVIINNSVITESTIASCDSFALPWGQSVLESGDYTMTYQTQSGCDSTTLVHLTINISSPAYITNLTENDTLSCSRTSINLLASSGESYQWSGDLGNEGAVTITDPGVYSVLVTDVNGCSSVAEITIVGSNLPSVPIVTDAHPFAYCGSGKDTLIANAESGTTIDWYDAPSGGNIIKAGTISGVNKLITPILTASTTYYAEKRNISLNCVSILRTEVVVRVYPKPSAPLAVNASRCGSGQIQVGASASDDQTIDWYSASTGTAAAFSKGSSFLDTSLTTLSKTFYAVARDSVTGCFSSSRTAVTATYYAIPAAVTSVANASRCGEGIVSLSVSAPTGTTISWYSDSLISDNVLSSGTVYTTNSLNATSLYWVVSKSAAGCYASTLKRVTATINTIPEVPNVSGNTRCGSGTLLLSATPPLGATVTWYNVSTGGSVLSTASNYTTSSISATTTYYVEAKNAATAGNCVSSSRREVVAVVNTTPSAPVSVNASRCGAGSIQVGATASENQTIDWFATSTGTSAAFKTGSFILDTSVSTASKLFYAASRDLTTGCYSSTRATVTATYNALPSAVSTVVNASKCGEGIVTLSATPPTGTVIEWYSDSAIAGSSLNTGPSFTTSALVSTTLFWLASKNTVSGCYAAALKKITATINQIPSAPSATDNSRCSTGTVLLSAVPPAGATVAWYNVSIGGTALSTVSNYTTPSIASTSTYFAESKNSALAGACVSSNRTKVIAFVNASPAAPTSLNSSRCGIGAIQIGANPIISEEVQTIDWYSAATGTSLPFKTASLTLDTSIIATKLFYAAARNISTGCPSSTRTLVTATYNALPTAISTVVNTSRCGQGSVSLSATPQSGTSIEWYSDSSRFGSLLNTGSSYTTPTLTSTTLYWLISKNNSTGCYSSALKRITATINQVPAAPSASGNARCSTGTVLLTAVPVSGTSVAWYNVSSGGTTLSTSSNYTTASLTTTTTYYVEAKNASTAGSCVSQTRTAVLATINDKPTQPTAVNGYRCLAGKVSISAVPSNPSQTIDWYAATTGSAFKSGLLTIDTFLSATKTFYAASRITATGCSSNVRTAVVATVNTAAPTSAPTSITSALVSDVCGARIYRYSAATVSGASSYNWTLPLGVASLDSGSSGNVIRLMFTSAQASAITDSIKVRAVNACASGPSRSLKLSLIQCTPLVGKMSNVTNSIKQGMQISVFPNPTKDNFNVKVISADNRDVLIRVIDVQGRILTSLKSKPNQQFNLGAELKSGYYIIEYNQDNNINTYKVLKY